MGALNSTYGTEPTIPVVAPAPAGRGPPGRGVPGRGAVGRGGAAAGGAAKGPQPTKPVIKPSKKLKAFFWKRVILAEDAPPSALWKQIPEPPINVDEIVELYADNKAPAPG